ncbi:uncharacterized protein LOC130975378 [Arachis stenosperma]|uniref:uncharacterized protein LOC130975378 n=1 Tax=Arachis stenosperma TaxID=217475 RepID=UPI0025ACB325|nr:uncharacterized protein LOC130975378 [Arachis stenosperma]
MPQHVMKLYAASHDSANEDDSEGDSTYVAGFGFGSSSDTASEDEYVSETSTDGVGRFRICKAVLMAMKNYSIRRNEKYRVLESDRLKYHCSCKKFTNGYPCCLRVALCQNLNYWEMQRFGRAHTCLAPTMSQDHAQLDGGVICKVVLSMIKIDPSVSISVLQSTVHKSYCFKSSYRKECLPSTIYAWVAVLYYNRDMVDGEWSQIDKAFWAFPPCIKAFKYCKPFVSVDRIHLYGKYGAVLLIVVVQDGNNNILLIAFALVESETMES